jgi:hypothetical protein
MPALRPEIRYPSRPSGPAPSRPRAPSRAAAAAGLLALMLLAGCTGGTGGGDVNARPNAELDVRDDNGWTGEDFTFDASKSTDDGEIVTYRFDFGDGTPPVEVTEEDQANSVTHRYLRGGQFTVTLTVTDDGKDNTGALSDNDSERVTVNERMRVATTSLEALGTNSTGAQPFKVYEEANRFEMNLTLVSALPSGSSEFEVRVVDPEGDTLAEKQVTVGPGTSGQEVTLDGLLTKEGEHRVEVEATSGGGTAEGEIRIIYGEDLPG